MSSPTSKPINAAEKGVLSRILKKLKRHESKTCSPEEQVLLTRLLLEKPKDSTSPHWYCHLATDLTSEAATYCQMWLVANDSTTEAVVNWKKCHQTILDSCVNCVKGMEDALLGSQFTYLSDHRKEKLDLYIQRYVDWNASRLHKHLARLGDSASLDQLHPAQSYHIFYNPAILGHSEIWPILKKKIPSREIDGWPKEAPAGLVPMLFLQSSYIREWAGSQLEIMMVPPEFLPSVEDNFYKRTYDGLLTVLVSTSRLNVSLPPTNIFHNIFNGLSSSTFWTFLPTLLRRFPELATSTLVITDEKLGEVGRRTNLIGILINHLSRQDEVFLVALQTFEMILQLLGSEAWRKKDQKLPEIALDAIKENKNFLSVNSYRKGAEAGSLGWLEPFLKSVLPLRNYSEIVHRVFQIFLEQLQHESMQAIRHITLAYFFSAVNQLLCLPVENGLDHRVAILDATNIHSGLIFATALGKFFTGPEWDPPRKYARQFLLEHLSHDVQQIHTALSTVASLEKDENGTLPSVSSSYDGLWEAVRNNLRVEDLNGHEFLIQAVSKSALLVPLPPTRLSFKHGSLVRPKVEKLLEKVNKAISHMHRGFDEIILRLVDATSESNLTLFCRRKAVGLLVISLLLSPIKPLSDGAQTLVGQSFNADGRVECLRVLLENQCEATLEAINSQLESFNAVGTEYLDAVDTAKVLVRCYTDILEVLCSIDGGLLFDEQFIVRNKHSFGVLPQLWRGMCKAAGIIIERTPDWATRYRQSDMTPWMRDALIFGNELVEKRRVFESVLAGPQKSVMTPNEGALVGDLSLIMRPLVSWLRLTHQELLDLSYNLLHDIFQAFKDTSQQPEEKLLQFLEGFVKKLAVKKHDAKSGGNIQDRTKLGERQLGTLQRDVADLLGDKDSDIEFVSQTFSPKKQPILPATRPVAPLPKPLYRPVVSKGKGPKTLPSGAKPGGFLEKLRRGAADGMVSSGLNAKLIQSAIAERQAGKSNAVINLTSSSGGEPSSSSSESDSEEEDAPSGLAQLSKLQKSPIKQQKQERKRTILLNDSSMHQTAGKAPHITAERHRQIQKQQIRYIPDMTPLHRIILNWDYDYDGPEPPTTTGALLVLKPVPDRFSSYRHYLDIMHPLLVVECWNALSRSKEEPLDKVTIVVASKMHADYWVEIDAVVEQSVPKGWMLLETDIILMEHASGKKTLGKVHSSRQTRQGIQATIRYSSELNDMDLERVMTLKSSWFVSRVFNLSTIHREYAALMGMNHYDWADAVYGSRIDVPVVPTESQIRKVMLAQKLNNPQARAVISSLETPGFSLIQGPPGTGKTSTICGLVGAFLSSRGGPATSIQVGKTSNKTVIPRKALVCAPSNAAIDEVAKRIKDGVWKSDGSKTVPNVVRLGADASINVSVKEISLEQLVEERMSRTNSSHSEAATEIATLRAELSRVRQLRQDKLDEMKSSKTSSTRIMQLEQDLRELSSKRIQLSSRLTTAQDKGKEAARAVDSAKRKARLDVLNDADVVCCTLSGSGHDIIEQFEFDLVIIDEAAQAIELSSLIPLKFSSNRCIMVGDPQQLPPTVISQTATRLRYNQSLFVRLQLSNPGRVHLLSIQYRMHPEISRLPSALFYDGQLIDGPDMDKKTFQPWHTNESLGVFKFFDTRGQEEQADSGHSHYNMAEVHTAVALFAKLRREYPDIDFDYRIGVISMYRAQLAKLKNEFASRWGRDILSKVDFNTVDGFQGQEKDIIILSCVRAGPNVSSIGFLSDVRRMNVSITRSRSSLFILGHAPTLKRSNLLWEKIVGDASARGLLVLADASYLNSSKPMVRSILPADARMAPATTRPSDKAQLPRSMKSLTPKDWKAQNDQKMREGTSKAIDTPSDYQPKGAYVRPGTGEADTAATVAHPREEIQTNILESNMVPGYSRKRKLSDPEQPALQAPALRQAVPASTTPSSTMPSSHVASTSAVPSSVTVPPGPKPAAKPKAPNLFIPKKTVKRPLPSDAPYPDPKRKPI